MRALQQPRPAAPTPSISVRVGERFVFLDPARRLDPERFVQVHRSVIVNVSCIREMQPWFKGDYVITLRDGSRITSGRSFRESVRGLLGR